ncbi:MAG: GGDEF domain-containing protein [Legionella sp.]|uniref:GGDEF domain-containing protein n=1 Tax=Legionella sp. TaxID=459 RepID=UPI00284CE078|nr:GGDEF domain-containing protein [Legionella sp.]
MNKPDIADRVDDTTEEYKSLLDAKTYKSLFDHMLNGIAYCQMLYEDGIPQDFVYVYTNPAFHTQTGLGNVIGKRVTEVIPGIRNTDASLFETYGRVARTGVAEEFEIHLEALNEWYAVSVYSPQTDYFVAVFDVITEKIHAESIRNKALAEAQQFREVLDYAPTYIYMKDCQFCYTYANRPTLELFNCSTEELIGSDDTRFFPPQTVELLREVDTRVLNGACTREEIDVDDKVNGRRVYWEVKAPIYEDIERTKICGLCGISTDITVRKQLEQQLEYQARIDYLTGLANRGYFIELAKKELARNHRYSGFLSIAMLDIDHFKNVNDTYGHEVGDRVLKAFSSTCTDTLRESDLIGRMGGEEFAIIFPETNASQAFEVAERIRLAISALDIPMEHGLPIHITVSLGLASLIESDYNIYSGPGFLGQRNGVNFLFKETANEKRCSQSRCSGRRA